MSLTYADTLLFYLLLVLLGVAIGLGLSAALNIVWPAEAVCPRCLERWMGKKRLGGYQPRASGLDINQPPSGGSAVTTPPSDRLGNAGTK